MAYNAFDNTTDSWNNLKTTTTTGWTNSWSADAGNFEKISVGSIDDATRNLAATVVSGTSTVLSDIATLVGGDSKALVDVADAASGAALDFLQKKLDSIKTAWNTPTTVTVKALLDEIAPYCSGGKAQVAEALPKIGKMVTSMLNEILGTSGSSISEILQDFGTQALDYVTSSAEFSDSMANLAAVKTFADSLQTVTEGIEGVKAILKILEPLRPVLETVYYFAAAWCTGGASAALGTNNMSETIEAVIMRLLSFGMKTVRKYVYNIKINIPSLLVDMYDASGLSIKDVVTANWEKNVFYGGDGAVVYGAVNAMLSDKYYEDNLATPSWFEGLNKVQNKINNLSFTFSGASSDDKAKKYLATVTQNVMNAAVRNARKTSAVPDYNTVMWQDPTTWYTKAQSSWTRASNSYKWAQYALEGRLSEYTEDSTIYDSEDNPIKSYVDVIEVSKLLLGSKMYRDWTDSEEE